MRAQEFIRENWGIEYYPNPVPMGMYKGPDEDMFLPPGNYKDVANLYIDIDNFLDAGIQPYVTTIDPKLLRATQPFISNSTGDGALYDEFQDHPLIYDKDGTYYILDGHHRSAAALKANRPLKVYLYSDEMKEQPGDEDDDELHEDVDYMQGHCHVMALALKKLNPDWQIRAHIGWDEEAESDEDHRVDHVYIVAPNGRAYDCRGSFDSEQELVGPNETGGVETQFVDYTVDDIRNDVRRGELKSFNRTDLDAAIKFAQRLDKQ